MKRKIIIDSSEPSSSDIQSKRNWAEIEPAIGNTRSKWVTAGLSALLIGAVVSLFTWIGGSRDNTATASIDGNELDTLMVEETSFPLFKSSNVQRFTIDATIDNIIVTEEGVIISINQGDLGIDQGPIQIEFEDLRDTWEIYNSGIPMDYTDGKRSFFKSAGMFRLEATYKSRPLSVKEGSAIIVSYPTTSTEEGMNTYHLNEDEIWEFYDTSLTESLELACAKHSLVITNPNSSERSKTSNKSSKPDVSLVEPRLANKDNYRFNLDIDPKEFPEFTAFKNIQFEAVDPRFSYHFYNETWEDIALQPLEDGQYLVVLKKKKKEHRFKVYPVLDEVDFEVAFAEYEAAVASSTSIEVDDDDYHEQWQSDMNSRPSVSINPLKKGTKLLKALAGEMEEFKPYRSVGIPDLGIWNFDKTIDFPVGTGVSASFVAKDGEVVIRLPHIYLIELETPLFCEYRGSQFRDFRFRPNKTNVAIAVVPDGRMAFVLPEKFKSLDKKTSEFTFEMTLTERPVVSLDELRTYLAEMGLESPDPEL